MFDQITPEQINELASEYDPGPVLSAIRAQNAQMGVGMPGAVPSFNTSVFGQPMAQFGPNGNTGTPAVGSPATPTGSPLSLQQTMAMGSMMPKPVAPHYAPAAGLASPGRQVTQTNNAPGVETATPAAKKQASLAAILNGRV